MGRCPLAPPFSFFLGLPEIFCGPAYLMGLVGLLAGKGTC